MPRTPMYPRSLPLVINYLLKILPHCFSSPSFFSPLGLQALQVEHTMGLLEGGLSDTAAVRVSQVPLHPDLLVMTIVFCVCVCVCVPGYGWVVYVQSPVLTSLFPWPVFPPLFWHLLSVLKLRVFSFSFLSVVFYCRRYRKMPGRFTITFICHR